MTDVTTTRHPATLERVLGLSVVLVGVGIGAQKLGDNSFLTHLATGRQMLDHGVVREDVFTWTSGGESLVVQSWLASLLYGLVDELGGFHGLRILMAVSTGVLAGLLWLLTDRNSSVLIRAAVMVPMLWIGLHAWTERPLLIAFVLLALMLVIAEGRGDPRWLVIVGVVWISVHGSWPLGLMILGARWFGSRIDRAAGGDPVTTEWRDRDVDSAIWLSVGVVLAGIVNPYGPRLLLFPFDLLGRHETLRHVSEWQASGFESTWSQAFLVLVVVVVIAARRARWQRIVPTLVIVVMALLSSRNIPVAVITMMPLRGEGLPQPRPTDRNYTSSAVHLASRALTALVIALPLIAIRGPHVDMKRYPIDAINAMENIGLSPTEVSVVHQDFVGNYLDIRYAEAGAAWIDDRFELHDAELIDDYLTLLDGAPSWNDVLDQYEPTAILWPTDRVLVALALGTGEWTVTWQDDDWTVLCSVAASECQP